MNKSRYAVSMALLFLVAHAAANAFGAGDTKSGDCATCHTAAVPITGAAQLRACTRTAEEAEPVQTSADAPDVFILDQLSEIYVPVVFPHKLHASMTEMGQGCDICHHRSPEGRIPPCRECHGGASNPVNLRQPGLKGAYHRQCLGCHREWTHATDCVICHAKIDPSAPFEPPEDLTDIMGILHPNIEVPDVKIYRVDELEDTPFVTFHHKDHAERFGLKCVDCHQQESCSRCHDLGGPAKHLREDPHEDCNSCHQQKPADTDCMFCHKAEAVGRFSHEIRTGFALKAFHEALACTSCHDAPRNFKGLTRECTQCHTENWPPAEFDHTRINVHIDEMHAELDCGDCHGEGIGADTTCAACHEEENMRFPVPGEDEEDGGEASDGS